MYVEIPEDLTISIHSLVKRETQAMHTLNWAVSAFQSTPS